MATEKTPKPDDDKAKTGDRPADAESKKPEAVQVPTPVPPEDDDDAMVDFGALPDDQGSGEVKSRSQISGPLSGTSVVSWSDLMRARSEAVIDLDSAEAVDFDADSDRDLLARALADEPPSGELDIPAAGSQTDSKEHSILDFEVRDDQASSILHGSEAPRRPEDSSRVNLLRDLAAGAGTGSSQKTDQLDSPVILSPPDDEDAAELGAAPSHDVESSAVDLGSQSVVDLPFPLATDSSVQASGGSGPKTKTKGSSRSGFEDSGTVDLLGSGKGSGLSSLPGLTAVGSGARPDSNLPSTAVVGGLPSARSTAWLGGGLLGALAGVGVCVGVWLSGVLPGGKKETANNKPDAAVQSAVVTPLADPGIKEAIALSNDHKYEEAQAKLAAARAVQEKRAADAGATTGPTLDAALVDGFEQIKSYWDIREALLKGGFKQTQQGGTLTTVKALVEEEKHLRAVREKVKAINLDPRNLAVAFDTIFKAKTSAETQLAKAKADATTAVQARNQVTQELATTKTALTEAETRAKNATSALGDAEAKAKANAQELEKVKAQLAAMPAAGGDAAAMARARQEREMLEARAKALENELASAKENAARIANMARQSSAVVNMVREKLQVAGTNPEDLMEALNKAMTAKPAAPAGLIPELPAAATSDPRADRAFGRGLIALRSGDVATAEQQLAAATSLNDRDARYWYFLGAVRAMQGKPADADFRRGFERERRNLPNPGEVDAALENQRPQVRQLINGARGR